MNIKDLEKYAIDHTTEESALVQELVEASDRELEHIDMLSGRIVAGILRILVQISRAQRVLEVGTFTGYSALNMAEVLPEGAEIYTCEYNKRYENIARRFFTKYKEQGGQARITLLMGKALETIPQVEGSFDMVFLDADKINYPNYYKLLLPRLGKGGIMAVDNVFWGGEVVTASNEKAKAIDRLNRLIADDTSVEQVMLTVRDGLTIIRKK